MSIDGTFELVSTITKENFQSGAERLLSQAADFGIATEDSIDAAQELLVALDKVSKGEMSVQPPLEKAEITAYEERAHTVITMGEKAVIGIDTSRRGRKRLAKLAAQQAMSRLPAPSFRGEGSAAKSY